MAIVVRSAATLLVGLSVITFTSADAAADNDRLESGEVREAVRAMITHARDRVFPALVNIEVVTVNYWGGVERKGTSIGSGTIISAEGHVLTNYHVVENGAKYSCRLADKREIGAKLVGEDPLTDLAVLQLNLDELKQDEHLPVAEFGDSDQLAVGDYVMAMGSPLALSRSVTLGIVSNTERVFAGDDSAPDDLEFYSGQRTGLFTRWIQHDALIHPGNSGGPLVNLSGQIVGVNTRGGGGQGFAIPSKQAHRVADTLIAHGEVARSYYGLRLRSLKATGRDTGAVVNSVVDGGPVYTAGIRAGDIILSVAGEPVTVKYVEELPLLMKTMANRPPGSTVAVEYERAGERHAAEVVTAKLEKDVGDEDAFRAWGLTAMDITEKIARDRRLDSTAGVIVTSTRRGGSAELAEPAIDRGDVIRAIDHESVHDLRGFIAMYREIMERDPLPEFLLVEFEHNGRNELTLLKPKPDEDEDPPRELPKAWIGIDTQPLLRNLADKLGLKDLRGYRVTRVFPHTQAAETTLAVGDIITRLNDTDLQPAGMQDAGAFGRLVRRLEIGDTASLAVVRDGAALTLEVPLERTRISPKEARRDRNRDFDLGVRELTFFDRDDNRWDEDVKGVLVESVESAGWAARAGLASGDLIQRINDYPVRGLKSYRRALTKIAAEQPERVVFVVLRGVETSYLFVEPDWTPSAADEPANPESE